MATLAAHQPTSARPTHWKEDNPTKGDLSHIPGEQGLPVIGNTFKMLADPPAFTRAMVEKYGRVYRNNAFGGTVVALVGADANELVLFDRKKIFSSEQGWGPILDQLFPRGLMLMDFDHHRADRKALSIAFKPEPMRHYVGSLNHGIALDLAADSFIGIPFGEESQKVNQAFVDMVQASVAPIRKPLPFTKMKRGTDGRAYLVEYFTKETERRRAEGGGQDMFSQFATATRDDGSLLPVDEVVDHMNFLMMAAHDTITSSATTLVYYLAKNPEWQEKLREELRAITGGEGRALNYEELGQAELTEMAFKEALRMMPPVPSIPRRALEAFEFGGYRIPAGTPVGVNPHFVHHDPEIWDEPEKFDPLRFTREAEKARHKYAWVPFGGGAHMCLGLHFAYMQIKILMAHMLTTYRIEVADGYAPEWQAWPIPQPKDGLQIALRKI